MGIQNNLNVIHNSRKSLLHLAMLTSIVAVTAASFSSSNNGVAAQATSSSDLLSSPPLDTHRSVAIPFCDEKHERTIGRRLLYVTTLDGRLSALDITKGGKLRWSIPTGPGPLISSSIHRLELTNNGQFVRMIPSLSGGIYKFDGESIDPIPITTENLLSSSAKFSDDLVISGGKETRTYGVSARTGKLLYECSMHGCSNATDAGMNVTPAPSRDNDNDDDDADEDYEEDAAARDYLKEHDPLVDDVIVVRRQTQTVRAVESRTGVERWNFSVGQHELDLIKSADCHDRQFSDMDMAILDLDVKVIVPEGVIYAFSKSEPNSLLWKYKFDHPIVSGWKISASDKLESIDMFGSAQWLWDQDDNIFESPFPSISPSIYLGMYEKQLYIQESVNLRREIVDQSNLYTHLTTESHLPIIPWRPIPASSNSLILFHNGDDKLNTLPANPNEVTSANTNIHGNELVPYDEENFAISAQSVLNGSEYVNGNGFYLFARDDFNQNNAEALCDSEEGDDDDTAVIDEGTEESGANETNHTLSNDLDFNLDDLDAPVKVVILSLWFWWKEIIVIAITTAVLLNLFIGSRQRPEVVVIERHIPVPTAYEATESSTQALLGPITNGTTTTTAGTTKSNSNGMLTNGVAHRSLSESTSISGEHFSSRFQGDFDLVRCLGRGGFGVVFEAKNKLDDCKYAVKRITLPNKKESRERVMREVKTLANCEHQNIVRYFQAWVETPPPGWQEEEDTKLLAHEMSTSIQIETPDGTTFPSFANSLPAIDPPHGKLQKEKKKQLISWVSSVTSTACSSDHDDDHCIKEVDEDEEDDDSLIVFRTESQSMALREEGDDEDDADESNVNQKQSHKSQSNAIAIDIHSNSWSLGVDGDERSKMMNGKKNIDYSQLSNSFQIEFVRSANGDDDGFETDEEEAANDADQSASKSDPKQKRSVHHLALDLKNNNNNNCKALLPAGKAITPPHTTTPSPPQKPMQNKVYLYIQMQLCRKESLRDWLRENRTEARINHIGSIFHQIVDAVDYVHLKGLIHRDLKPSNIFFSQDGQIKIGDFGLVTDMSDIPNMITQCGDTSGLPSCARHTQQVGTHLYMSPEQLRGQHYDYKVDIYSLGLIYFELLVYFGTEMERIVTLRDLRDGRYPKQFPVDYAKEYDLLQLMLSPKPEERPATLELKLKLNDILQLPELLVGDSEAAALAAVARRLSRSRTISSSD